MLNTTSSKNGKALMVVRQLSIALIVREQKPKNGSFVQPSPQKMFDT